MTWPKALAQTGICLQIDVSQVAIAEIFLTVGMVVVMENMGSCIKGTLLTTSQTLKVSTTAASKTSTKLANRQCHNTLQPPSLQDWDAQLLHKFHQWIHLIESVSISITLNSTLNTHHKCHNLCSCSHNHTSVEHWCFLAKSSHKN